MGGRATTASFSNFVVADLARGGAPPAAPDHPVLTQHYPMLQRNLLYTGITRGKRLVVLVGQKKAMAIAVRNVSARRRWSKLDEWLRLGAPSQRSSSAGSVGQPSDNCDA